MERLFVAIGLPEGLRDALSVHRGGLEGARWTDPDDYHVTLRFIGEVSNDVAYRLADALDQVTASPFIARVTGFDAFGGDKPRSVHARVELSPELDDLQGAVEAACRAVVGPGETRRYVPHITLARIHRGEAGAVSRWLEGREILGQDAFDVVRFSIYSARPGGGGPYHPIADFSLL